MQFWYWRIYFNRFLMVLIFDYYDYYTNSCGTSCQTCDFWRHVLIDRLDFWQWRLHDKRYMPRPSDHPLVLPYEAEEFYLGSTKSTHKDGPPRWPTLRAGFWNFLFTILHSNIHKCGNKKILRQRCVTRMRQCYIFYLLCQHFWRLILPLFTVLKLIVFPVS